MLRLQKGCNKNSIGFSSLIRCSSTWSQVPLGPPDSILGLTEAFKKDTSPLKINLGVGAYRDDKGKPYVLNSVAEAEKKLHALALDKEYLPIGGYAKFVSAALDLAYGQDCKPLKEKRIVGVQSISGTGALRIGGEFLNKFYPSKTIYIPTPTWGNHAAIFKASGLNVASYRYFDKNTLGLDLNGLLKDISGAPDKSIFLLHACAHNPTGVDPNEDQWKEICKAIERKGHFAFFDMAYQGFASGDCDKDAFALRYFANKNIPLCLAQSFAKNMGLYGERVGTFSISVGNQIEREAVESQIKIIIRSNYSNPPLNGARLIETVLNEKDLKDKWLSELKIMSQRIMDMRVLLKEKILQGNNRNWDHITNQIGMFCFTGLKPEEVDRLAKEFHIYLTRDGRISISGINSSNVSYLAKSIQAVLSK